MRSKKGMKTVLVNPPLWNAYAPHLAVPLLLGDLRAHGYEATAYDLSIECVDWMLSAPALEQLRRKAAARRSVGLRDEWARRRAQLVAPAAIRDIEEAKARLKSLATLHDPAAFHAARRTLRDALWLVSGAFPSCDFDLVSNTCAYSAESTLQVLAASGDAEGNPYRWAFDRMLDRDLLLDPTVGVVAVSMSADTQLIAAVTFLSMVKDMRPDVHVVLGGNYATRLVDRWQHRHALFDYVDTVVTGEGEGALAAVVDGLTEGGTATADFREKIPGAVWADNGILLRTPRQSADISAAVKPAYDALPLDKYLAPGPILPVFASRSCPWDCAFCSIPFASNSFRQRPGEAVAEEVRALRAQHGSRYFMFVDEIMSPRTLRNVSEALVSTSADVYWYGETRFAGGLDDELAGLLHRSGCRRMNFGLESASQRVLDLMRKGTRIEDACENITSMLKAGVPIHLFVIHGFPGETREEAERTVAFAEAVRRLSVHHYGVAHTTWGGSPFVLDVHAPIGTQPEAFGIRIDPPDPAEDLSLSRDYRTVSGMSQQDSLRVAEDASGSADDTGVWFRAVRDPMAREIEEFTFLRASVRAAPPEPLPVPLFDWPPPDPDARLTLAPGVTFTRVPWPATEADTEPAMALYNPAHDRFLQLNWVGDLDWRQLDGLAWRDLEAWLTYQNCHYLGCGPADTAALLLRHGLLVPSRRQVRSPDARLRPEIGIAMETRRATPYLSNPITGVTIRLRGEAVATWQRWQNGETPATGEADAVTDALVRHGFLYREPAGARQNQPRYLAQGQEA
ncbi:radical SAM protein [Streptomyces sp. SDr-06]|uniref:B12-binding domain-containing radical SAM protein n=1 Tax=Streptomyces sp. SDr-06 TaxID=2267702 RepID=UPI000DEB0730|nr:radical SAM protein [Streptomyces sp. SDr-06]RCH67729.1 radical SAM protein [Streptomyces sp. SDr-06]